MGMFKWHKLYTMSHRAPINNLIRHKSHLIPFNVILQLTKQKSGFNEVCGKNTKHLKPTTNLRKQFAKTWLNIAKQ